jgi:hypothetical protein
VTRRRRWPWQSPESEPVIVDTKVADRLEEVAGRLEQIAAELSQRVQQIQREEDEHGR